MLPALFLIATAVPPPAVQAQNVQAFARIYGYVRFFHPSDEASRVDWDRLAILGSERVRSAETSADLQRVLEELFGPIAPTVRIGFGVAPEQPLDLRPDNIENLSVVAWQHKGVGLQQRGTYDSIRTHRSSQRLVSGAGFGTITQAAPAVAHRGKNLRLRAAVKTAVTGTNGEGRLWVRVDRASGAGGFFDNMSGRPIRSDSWAIFEIPGVIDDDAERVVFGGFLLGAGSVWLDSFELQVEEADGTLRSLPLDNPGFETGAELFGWNATSAGYRYHVEERGCFQGSRCARIDATYETSPTRLFDAVPEVGEVTTAHLPRGLRVDVPLALYGDETRTYGGRTEESELDELLRSVESVEGDDVHSTSRRLGAVVIAWNVFQHFYPYFDVVGADWTGVLTESIAKTLAAEDEAAFERVLKQMLVPLRDGHANVHRRGSEERAWLPLALGWVEGHVVVTGSESPEVERGDILLGLDGQPASGRLEALEALVSGSPQWKRHRALAELGAGTPGEPVRLALRRGAEELERTLPRTRESPLSESRPDPVSELREGIYYCDLTRAPYETIRPHLDRMAAAAGVVFDMRGYPRSDAHLVVAHLSDEPLRSAQWMVPQTIYPDGVERVGYDTSGQWSLPPHSPRFRGKAAFLTDAGAISYGETLMGIVEHYRLGEIVGLPTAGTNGNVNPFNLPGDYRVFWTGMKVLKHDGSQHHLVGIRPTVTVERTLVAVREGRDECLETALELVDAVRD